MSLAGDIRAGRAYVEVTAESSKFKKGLTDAQARLQAFGRTCSGMAGDLLALSGSLAVPLGLATRSFAGFDDRMRMVQGVTQATTRDLATMTKTAQRLGRETSFTAQQAADAMIALGRMGFRPGEIDASIGAVLDLSRATGTELAEAADIAANSLRIFGMEAPRMSEAVDVLTATANGSAQTLEDLFEGLKMVGPQASAAGEDIRETCAALGVLANVGIKGSLAGTALRKSFARFANADVRELLASYGVEATTADGNLRKMAETMRDIAAVMAKMPTAEKLAFAEAVFDVRGSLAGLSLGADIDGLDNFLARLRETSGVAAETSKRMDAGLGGSFRLLMSAVEGVANSIGETLDTSLRGAVDGVTAWTNGLTRWIEENGGLVTSLAVSVASVAAFSGALLAVGVAAKSAGAAVAAVKAVSTGLTFAFGALAGEGATLRTSFKLITSALSNFRNMAVPAMVGTSQLLAAFNLPLDRRAHQIAASFLLMGRAETVLAAKAVLSARFSAMATALRSVSASSLLAAASSRAHALAMTASAVVTRALTAARMAGAAALALFTSGTGRATVAAAASTVANTTLAASAKAVAGGFLLASGAARAFCAIPIVWILVAIIGTVGLVMKKMADAARHTATLSDSMQKLREKGDDLRRSDELRVTRLKQLAERQKLSDSEMAEAVRLSSVLRSRYGELGIEIDRAGHNIRMAADSQERFNAAMRRASASSIRAEILELSNNLRELEKENEGLANGWSVAWDFVTFRGGRASEKIEANSQKAEAAIKRLYAARQRLKAIEGGDTSAATGTKEDLSTAVSRGAAERSATVSEAEAAAKRLGEIEEKIARDGRSRIENEIHDIRALNDEYKELLRTVLSYEKGRANADAGKIADLEKRLADADRKTAERVASAMAREREQFEAEAAGFRREFTEQAGAVEAARRERAEDRAISDTLARDRAEGLRVLATLLDGAKAAAASARAGFSRVLSGAEADGVISDREGEAIRRAQEAYLKAESMVDRYAGKLEEAREGTAKAAAHASPVGAFYMAAIEALGGKAIQERLANSSEKIAKNTQETNKLLKKQRGGLVFQ